MDYGGKASKIINIMDPTAALFEYQEKVRMIPFCKFQDEGNSKHGGAGIGRHSPNLYKTEEGKNRRSIEHVLFHHQGNPAHEQQEAAANSPLHQWQNPISPMATTSPLDQ